MNPWLAIPLADYEQHMAMPDIAQAQLLGDQLQRLVEVHRPQSLAVLGVAGGNGLERLNASIVKRVVAVDVNPTYVGSCQQRHAARFECFEPLVHDLTHGMPAIEPVDMVFAGLVLEYLPQEQWTRVLTERLTPEGIASVVLQLPSAHLTEVSQSPYTSLKSLEPVFHFVSPGRLHSAMEAISFTEVDASQVTLPSGKSFHVSNWQRHKEL